MLRGLYRLIFGHGWLARVPGLPVTILIAYGMMTLINGAPLQAACTRTVGTGTGNVPNSGDTVVCSGTDTGGVVNSAADSVTVNVLTGATLSNNMLDQVIWLRDINSITNNGTITGGPSGVGILAADSNNTGFGTGIVNSGAIALGDFGTGISVGNFNLVTNNGSITAGSSSFGIVAGDNNNTIFSGGITNSGTIALGDDGHGILVNDGNVVTNSGTITAGTHSYGIVANNNNNIGTGITNSGTIALGDNAHGISVIDGNVVTNSGTITGGTTSYGITVNNSNIITNSGTIIGGTSSHGISMGDGNTLNNSGTIRSGNGGYSIDGFGNVTGNTVTNSGTLDGTVSLSGAFDSLTNSGLITITAPGTSIGQVHFLGGNFTQTSTGTLALRVTPDATPGSYDQLSLVGVANLDGTLRATVTPGLYGNTTTYLGVVDAGSVVGAFAQATSSSPFFTATAVPTVTGADLTLTRIPFGTFGATTNQHAVGSALEAGYSTALTGNAASLYGSLLATTGNPSTIYKQLSGEGIASSEHASFMAGSMFMDTIMDEATAWRGDDAVGIRTASLDATSSEPLAYAPAEPDHPAFKAVKAPVRLDVARWRAWGGVYGGHQTTKGDSDTGSSDATQHVFGGVIGVENRLNSDFLYGFAVGASSSHFNVADLDTSGDATGGHFGAYGLYNWGRAYLAGTLAYSYYANKTTRSVSTFNETENGNFSSNQLGAKIETGYRMQFGSWGLTPFANLQIAQLWQNGFTETASSGAGLAALTFGSQSVTSLPVSLGAQIDTRMTIGGMALSPFLRAAWVHEFKPDRQETAAFAAIPTASFTVDGPRAASDAARLDVGAKLAINESTAVFAKFGGEFSGSGNSYNGMGGLRYSW